MIICKFENNNEAKLRHAVVDTLVIKDGTILLVKRAQHIPEGGKWGLVGGYMERDENLLQAAAREAKEETGREIDSIQFFTVIDTPNRPHEDRQNISFIFICTAGEKIAESDWEVDEQRWFDLNDLPSEKEVAFDHLYVIELYKKSLTDKSIFPALISQK